MPTCYQRQPLRKEIYPIKKLFVCMLTLVMIFSLAGSALAVEIPMTYAFHISTDSTTEYQIGCTGIEKTENKWYISLDTSRSNLSPTHRAVTRVHAGANAASSTWVYSGPSTTMHSYKTNYQGVQFNLSYRGRLDNRDWGVLEFHGTFVTYFDPDS